MGRSGIVVDWGGGICPGVASAAGGVLADFELGAPRAQKAMRYHSLRCRGIVAFAPRRSALGDEAREADDVPEVSLAVGCTHVLRVACGARRGAPQPPRAERQLPEPTHQREEVPADDRANGRVSIERGHFRIRVTGRADRASAERCVRAGPQPRGAAWRAVR